MKKVSNNTLQKYSLKERKMKVWVSNMLVIVGDRQMSSLRLAVMKSLKKEKFWF